MVAAGVVFAESLLAQAGPELLTADRVVELAPALAGALGDFLVPHRHPAPRG